MAGRRILSLWFPRLAAERVLRQRRDIDVPPLAVVADRNGAQVLVSLSPGAEAAGLAPGQALRDATAICPGLLTVPEDPLAEARFLTGLRRWTGRFSPWVAEESPAALMIDLTGTAHLFGGEEAVLAQVAGDCADLGLTVRAGIADTPGAAWGLARFARAGVAPLRSGDMIDQEARATRSRAAKRRGWERGGSPPRRVTARGAETAVIAPPGALRAALADLPLAALRLEGATVDRLMRLGLKRVGDLMELPRAALARRFGSDTLRRLDQAMGMEPEPVSPARPPLHFAVRLTLPDPIGLRSDIEAALDRLLPPLCTRLRDRGRGARRVVLQAFRADGGVSVIEVGLARAADAPDRIRPLLHLKLDQIDPGFGIDCLRVEATATEAMVQVQHRGQLEVTAAAMDRQGGAGAPDRTHALDDLIGRLGARLGHEAVTRLLPSDSHVPAKSAQVLMAAWSAAHDGPWPAPSAPRPLVMFRPEPVEAPETPEPPARFRWRRRDFVVRMAAGPERLMPEWWLEDPDWRGGARDYWRVEVEGGERLWLFYGQGGAVTDRWYCEGLFP
jgi:protein ImuB